MGGLLIKTNPAFAGCYLGNDANVNVYVANLNGVIASLRLILGLSLKDNNLALEWDSLNILISNAITEKTGEKYFNDLKLLYKFKNKRDYIR
jgi:hypothetical protein